MKPLPEHIEETMSRIAVLLAVLRKSIFDDIDAMHGIDETPVAVIGYHHEIGPRYFTADAIDSRVIATRREGC